MSDTAHPRPIRLERRSPSYWRVTFDHPPLNIFGPKTIPPLNEIITALDTDAAAVDRWKAMPESLEVAPMVPVRIEEQLSSVGKRVAESSGLNSARLAADVSLGRRSVQWPSMSRTVP
jgi:hypothetical protein